LLKKIKFNQILFQGFRDFGVKNVL